MSSTKSTSLQRLCATALAVAFILTCASTSAAATKEAVRRRDDGKTWWVLRFTCPDRFKSVGKKSATLDGVRVHLFTGEKAPRSSKFKYAKAPTVGVGETADITVRIVETDKWRKQVVLTKTYKFAAGEAVQLDKSFSLRLKPDVIGKSELYCEVKVRRLFGGKPVLGFVGVINLKTPVIKVKK